MVTNNFYFSKTITQQFVPEDLEEFLAGYLNAYSGNSSQNWEKRLSKIEGVYLKFKCSIK